MNADFIMLSKPIYDLYVKEGIVVDDKLKGVKVVVDTMQKDLDKISKSINKKEN